MRSSIQDFHEAQIDKIDIPQWIKDINCPFCSKDIPLRSIRNIQLCLNTRNFGDVAVEVLCDECSQMDTLYFRERIKNISDFCEYLEGNKTPNEKPLIEEDMYKASYNNIVEKMAEMALQKGEGNGTL